MATPTYLILGSVFSGRRALCADVCKNAFGECRTAVFVASGEPQTAADSALEALENVRVFRYESGSDALEKLSQPVAGGGFDAVLFVADSRENIADAVENFKKIVDSGAVRLARIWSVFDCKMRDMFAKNVDGYIDALSHFADCVLLSNRGGVPNSTVKEITSKFKKDCRPHIVEFLDARGRVRNPLELTVEQTRRISMLFDEYDPVDELDLDEDNLPDEPFSLERKPDPYLERLQNGLRKNPVRDVSEFAVAAYKQTQQEREK